MTADSVTTPAVAPGAEYADTASAAYRVALQVIESVEPRIAAATRKELADQRDSLKLIASENYASPAVLLTMGTWLSDKYAEGTIGHRFYAGCQNVDTVESAGRRARPRAVRLAVRLRPAALGHRRQPRRVLGDPGHPGRGARAWPSSAPSTSTTCPRRTGRRCAPSWATSGCWACRWTPAATSPTASGPTSPARCSTSAATAPTRRPGCSTTTPSPPPPASSSR